MSLAGDAVAFDLNGYTSDCVEGSGIQRDPVACSLETLEIIGILSGTSSSGLAG